MTWNQSYHEKQKEIKMISRIHEAETLARTFDEYNLSSLVEVDIVNFKSTVQAFIKNLGWKWRISTSSKTIFHTD